MRTELVSLPALLLGGVGFYGDPLSVKGGWDVENGIGRTWQRYGAFVSANPVRPYSKNGRYCYEVHVYGAETADKGYFEVFVGEEVRTTELPIGLTAKFIPASDYLKVTLEGAEIAGDWWAKLDGEILPAHGRRRNAAYILQAYDERFKGTDRLEDSVMDAFIPVGGA